MFLASPSLGAPSAESKHFCINTGGKNAFESHSHLVASGICLATSCDHRSQALSVEDFTKPPRVLIVTRSRSDRNLACKGTVLATTIIFRYFFGDCYQWACFAPHKFILFSFSMNFVGFDLHSGAGMGFPNARCICWCWWSWKLVFVDVCVLGQNHMNNSCIVHAAKRHKPCTLGSHASRRGIAREILDKGGDLSTFLKGTEWISEAFIE